MSARVIVLAGPSGAGKSRLAARLGLPILHLDDFYKDGDDPTLPLLTASSPLVPTMVDWDDPASWNRDLALAAISSLCETGLAAVPVYSIPDNAATDTTVLNLGAARCFVAEGIFAAEVIEPCRQRRQLMAAYCITQHPLLTFWRRLTRDLREHRKPPLLLVRRGFALARVQRHIVAEAKAAGCRVATGDRAFRELRRRLP